MEFKLNKIDTDIRRKIDEQTKSDKVHSGKKINVNKDLNERHSKNNSKNEMENKRRYFTIDGVKYSKNEIQIEAEKNESIDIQNSMGRILDTKK